MRRVVIRRDAPNEDILVASAGSALARPRSI